MNMIFEKKLCRLRVKVNVVQYLQKILTEARDSYIDCSIAKCYTTDIN